MIDQQQRLRGQLRSHARLKALKDLVQGVVVQTLQHFQVHVEEHLVRHLNALQRAFRQSKQPLRPV